MAVVCVSLTLLASAPSLIALWRRPGPRGLLLALINTSLAFFLLSFQVHEKSILLVAVPVALYLPFDPVPCLVFLQTATFSMLPLLTQDGLLQAHIYIGLLYLVALRIIADCQLQRGPSTLDYWWDFLLIGRLFVYERDGPGVADVLGQLLGRKPALNTGDWRRTVPWRHTLIGLVYATLLLQIAMLYVLDQVQPPERLPHLWPLLISALSAAYFGLFFVYFTVKQWLMVEADVDSSGRPSTHED